MAGTGGSDTDLRGARACIDIPSSLSPDNLVLPLYNNKNVSYFLLKTDSNPCISNVNKIVLKISGEHRETIIFFLL